MNPTTSSQEITLDWRHLPARHLQTDFKSHWLAGTHSKVFENTSEPCWKHMCRAIWKPPSSLWVVLCNVVTALSYGSASTEADTWCDFSKLWCRWTHSVPGQSCRDWKRRSPVRSWYMAVGDQRQACLGIKRFKCSTGLALDSLSVSVCVCVCSVSCCQAARISKSLFVVLYFLNS